MDKRFSASEMSFFYLNKEKKSTVLRICLKLTEKIDTLVLKQATQKALTLFTKMSVKPMVAEDGSIVFTQNTSELPVFEEDFSSVFLGSEENNGYLFRISVNEENLLLSYFHCLGDGKAVIDFVRHLLFFYFELEGKVLNEESYILRETEGDYPFDEMNLPEKALEYLKENPIADDEKKDKAKAFYPYSEAELLDSEYNYIQILSWNNKDLLGLIHKLNTTPLCFWHMLMANVYLEVFDIPEGDIIKGEFAIDMRKYYGSNSLNNFASERSLSFKADWKKLDYEEQIAEINKEFKQVMNVSEISREILRIEKNSEALIDLCKPGDITTKAINKKIDERIEASYFISNMGIFNLPINVEEYVESFSFISSPVFNSSDFFIFTFKDKGYLLSVKPSSDERVMMCLSEKIKDLGIQCVLETIGRYESDHVDVNKFEKV